MDGEGRMYPQDYVDELKLQIEALQLIQRAFTYIKDKVMQVKLFEIRDRSTVIPAIAIKLGSRNKAEQNLLASSGFGRFPTNYVLVARLGRGSITYEANDWSNRTMYNAHLHIEKHFDELESGQVIDIEYLLGEKDDPSPPQATE